MQDISEIWEPVREIFFKKMKTELKFGVCGRDYKFAHAQNFTSHAVWWWQGGRFTQIERKPLILETKNQRNVSFI